MACAALALLLGAPGRANAADENEKVKLVYVRKPGAKQCPEEHFVHRAVARRLGYDPFVEDAPRTVTLTMSRRGDNFIGAGELTDAEGTPHSIQDPPFFDLDCKEVVLALAVSIVFELTPIKPNPEPTPPPPAPPPAAPPSPPSAPPAPAVKVYAPLPPAPAAPSLPARDPGPRRPPLQLGAGLILAVGRTPDPAPGLMVSADLRWSFVSIAIDGRALLPIFASELQNDIGQRADIRPLIVTTTAAPCLHPSALFFCVPIEFGFRQFTGVAGARARTPDQFMAGFGLRAGAEWSFARHYAIRGYLDGIMGMSGVVRIEGRDAWNAIPFSGVLSLAFVGTL